MSSSKNIENKLTPAALKALEDFVSEYRNQILLGAEQSAVRLTDDINEISIHDILTSIKKEQGAVIGKKYENLNEYNSRVVLIVAFTVLILTYIFILISNINNGSTIGSPLMYIIPLFGIFPAFFFLISKKGFQEMNQGIIKIENENINEKGIMDLTFLFIMKWQKLEISIREYLANQLGESNANAPIPILINLLGNKNLMSKRNIDKLIELLKIRNSIVHSGGTKEISNESLRKSISTADLYILFFSSIKK